MVEFKVSLYGVFRELTEQSYLIVLCDEDISASLLKTRLRDRILEINPYFNRAVIDNSVLANGNQVISVDQVVSRDQEIALFPPVCGG